MRIVLTGAAGYLGGNLEAALRAQQHELLPVDIAPRAGVSRLDVSNAERTEEAFRAFRPELAIHLAAIASVPRCEDDPSGCWSHNIGGTLNVANASRRVGARMIFFSSAAVYGQPKRLPTPVLEPLQPINLYGISKAAGEHIVRSRCPDSVVLRLFNVYGGYCARSYVIPDIIRKIDAGTPSIDLTGTGAETRDFLHVSDLLRIVSAARDAAAGSVFNAGSGRTITIRELAGVMARLMGRPEVLARFSGPRRGDFPINWADLSDGNVPPGWRPLTALEEGLTEMIASVRGQGPPPAAGTPTSASAPRLSRPVRPADGRA